MQITDGANDDRQRLALWAQQITAWSFSEQGIPIPSQNVGRPGGGLGLSLDGPDFNLLADATQELLDAVTASPTRAAKQREGLLNDLISYFHKSGKGVALPEGITDRDIWEDYFAEAFGWPPQVVAELPPRFLDVNPLIREARMRAAKLRGNSGGRRDAGRAGAAAGGHAGPGRRRRAAVAMEMARVYSVHLSRVTLRRTEAAPGQFGTPAPPLDSSRVPVRARWPGR